MKERIYPSNLDKDRHFFDDIVQFERREWRRVLGSPVAIPTLPQITKPQVKRLAEYETELECMPTFDVGSLSNLQRMGADRFLVEIQSRYPLWTRSDVETEHRRKGAYSRQLQPEYWALVAAGEIPFPKTSGYWMAVETAPLTALDYGKSKELTDLLHLPSRFGNSWNEVTAHIQKYGKEVVKTLGFDSSARLVLPDAMEWNLLLGNRRNLGSDGKYEMTSTYHPYSDSLASMVAMGDYRVGKNADMLRLPVFAESEHFGFRLGIYFS